ncbi:MAG TPA: hypothetical protein VNH84_12685 [Candidatus Saccharimonadales bacterium]|nr:hypothetical protein [Candidatus Saccharimonadales bacterium]
MSELADALMDDGNSGVQPAEIPSGEPGESGGASKTPPAEASPEKPLTLREQLNKSIESVRKEEATRARDVATGKFAKTDKPEIPAEKPVETKPDAQADPTSPPPIWSKVWETMSPEARALAVKREAEQAKGFEEYRGKTAQLTEITQVLDPIRPILQQNGIQSDAQAVKTLVEWEGAFRNPATRMQAFHNLARQYGVDLQSLVQSPSQPSPAQDIPEPLRPVIDQFGNIVQEVNTIKQQLQTAEQNRIASELTSFASKPEHAHFEKVRVMMGQLMQSGIVSPGDLEGAYQKAVTIHPEVSAAIEAEKQAKAQAELAKTNAEKAARARQAAVSPSVRSPNGAPVNGASVKPKGSSPRESILAAIGELREGQRA